jgi:hypothetical protein
VFARAAGISQNDLARLQGLEHRDGAYHSAGNADMRTMELMLLLNEE